MLERKAVHDNLRVQYEKQWRLQREAVEVMKSHLRILDEGVDALEVRKNVLSAWHVVAHARSLIAELQAFVDSNGPPQASSNER